MLSKKIKLRISNAIFISFLLVACNTENIIAKRDSQLNLLTAQAEMESDKIQPQYNNQLDSIIYSKYGLSINYFANSSAVLTDTSSNCNDSIQPATFAYHYNKLNLTGSEKHAVKLRLEHFSQLQYSVFQTAKKSIIETNDSFQRYKLRLKQQLEDKLISVSDYDQLMTESSKNFVSLLRQSYEENKIIVTASRNYRQVLSEIQSVLTEKQWEDFFSCVYKK